MKKITFTIIAIFFITIVGHSQNIDTASIKEFKKIFTKTEILPQFPGGMEGWRLYLEKNLNVALANDNLKVPKGQDQLIQTAKVKFIIDEAGIVSHLKVENLEEVHPKLAEEAIRIIAVGPKWIPAVQNGRKVVFQNIQHISWLVKG